MSSSPAPFSSFWLLSILPNVPVLFIPFLTPDTRSQFSSDPCHALAFLAFFPWRNSLGESFPRGKLIPFGIVHKERCLVVWKEQRLLPLWLGQ